MQLQKIIIKENLVTFKIMNLESQNIPFTNREIEEAFLQVGRDLGHSGGFSLVLNNKHRALNEEDNLLNDYIASFENGGVVVNLGCCFFDLEHIKDFDLAQVQEVVAFLLPDAFKAQPFIMKAYANRCYEKIQDVKHGFTKNK